jgi:hypothetical protein
MNQIDLKQQLEYNINECLKRGILPEYVKECKKILKEVK